MTVRIVFHAICTAQEFHVWNDLLHRAHIHLARTEARRARLLFDPFTVREIRDAEIQLLGGVVEDVPELF